MPACETPPEGDDNHDGKRTGPVRRFVRRAGPWVVPLILRVMIEWWFNHH
jgi:hypothetical protein